MYFNVMQPRGNEVPAGQCMTYPPAAGSQGGAIGEDPLEQWLLEADELGSTPEEEEADDSGLGAGRNESGGDSAVESGAAPSLRRNGTSSSVAGPSWAESLLFRPRRGAGGWDGMVPPDVVVIAPPSPSDSHAAEPEAPMHVAQPVGSAAAPAQVPRGQQDARRRAAADPASGCEQPETAAVVPQRGRRKGGRGAGTGQRSPQGKKMLVAPVWLQNLPPSR